MKIAYILTNSQRKVPYSMHFPEFQPGLGLHSLESAALSLHSESVDASGIRPNPFADLLSAVQRSQHYDFAQYSEQRLHGLHLASVKFLSG